MNDDLKDLTPERIVLSPEKFDAFMILLDQPAQSNPKLVELLRRPTVFDEDIYNPWCTNCEGQDTEVWTSQIDPLVTFGKCLHCGYAFGVTVRDSQYLNEDSMRYGVVCFTPLCREVAFDGYSTCELHAEEDRMRDETLDANSDHLEFGRCDTCGAPVDQDGLCSVVYAHKVCVE